MSDEKVKSVWDELLEPLVAPLEQLERERIIHHREVLTLTSFVHILVYYFVKQVDSGRLLVSESQSAEGRLELPEIKRSTLFDAFGRFPVGWFAMMLGVVLSSVVWHQVPELALLGKLYCIDGSLFPALCKMMWAEYKENKPGVKLHLCFSLNQMVPVNFIVGTGNSSERDALRQMLARGVTYIADRGYVCFKLLTEIVDANAHFVMRMKANLDYTVSQVLVVELPTTVHAVFSQVTDHLVTLNGAAGQPLYRLVTFQVGAESYLILTDRRDLTTFQVILLYAYRWQIELVFRFLKRTMNGLHFISTSPEGLTIQFYLLIITALLQLRLKQFCIDRFELAHPPTLTDDTCSTGDATLPTSSSRGAHFLATIGAKLQRYWKLSVHWLTHLRNRLAQPLDDIAIQALGGT